MRKIKIAMLAWSLIIPMVSMAAGKATKQIETFENRPDRAYSVISPISASKGSIDKAFERMKAKAAKLGADAVLEVKCVAGDKVRVGLFQIRAFGSDSVCQGLAVKWASGVDTD